MIDVTLAVTNQLKKIIPGAIVYRETPEQNLEEPSFYVYETMADSKVEIMGREIRTHLYCILWFPNSKKKDPGVKEQCEYMRNKLLDEFNQLDDLSVRLLDREAKIESDALHITFKIRYRVARLDRAPKIASLEQKGGLKHG